MRYNLFVLFLTIVCAMGFSQIEVVTRGTLMGLLHVASPQALSPGTLCDNGWLLHPAGDKLWIPQSSIPAENRDYVESVTSFGRPPRGGMYVVRRLQTALLCSDTSHGHSALT